MKLLASLLVTGFLTLNGLKGDTLGVTGARQSRFFNWDDVQNGFQQTMDTLHRSVDSVGKNLVNILGYSDGTRRRDDLPTLSDEPINIDAVGGSFSGIDDGLNVFFPNRMGPDDDDLFYRETHISPDLYPRPEKEPVEPLGPDTTSFNQRPFKFPSFKNIFGSDIFNIGRAKPWWSKENVCVDREEINESESNIEVKVDSPESANANKSPFRFFGSFQASSCSDNGEKYSCVTETNQNGIHKSVKTNYRCCQGFIRDGAECIKVDFKPMMEVLEGLTSASNFVAFLDSTGLADEVSTSNLTVFVPTNDALEEYTADIFEKNEIFGMNELQESTTDNLDFKEVLQSHLTEGFTFANDFKDEKLLPSLNRSTSVRINIYGGYPPIVTANCAPIIRQNVYSSNGVAHIVGQVVPSAEATLANIIDKDPQFSILRTLITNSGLNTALREPGQWTFLAPTNAAFERLNASTLESLLSNGPCVNAVLDHHLLPNTICSAAIQGRMKTINHAHNFLIVERTEDEKLFVEDAQIVVKDVVASNGVLHILDKVLLPDHAKPVKEILEYHNLTKFLNLLEEAELLSEIENGNHDLNIFAPSNNAIDNYPEDEMKLLRSNKEKLRELLRYHMLEGNLDVIGRQNNNVARTKAEHKLRFNLYSRTPLLNGLLNFRGTPLKMTAGCSRISLMNSRACGGVIHILEEMLRIPTGNILTELDNSKFSTFRQMIKDADYEEQLLNDGPFTVFAPSDHALKSLPQNELDTILNSTQLMKRVVQRHILPEHVCCSGINSNTWPFMDRKRTHDGTALHVRRTSYDQLMAGPARIIECGRPASNGVVHAVNRLAMNEREVAQLVNGGRTNEDDVAEWTKLFIRI